MALPGSVATKITSRKARPNTRSLARFLFQCVLQEHVEIVGGDGPHELACHSRIGRRLGPCSGQENDGCVGVGFRRRHGIEFSVIDEMKAGSGSCAWVGRFLRGCVQAIAQVAQGLFRARNHGAGAKMAGDAVCCGSMVMHV